MMRRGLAGVILGLSLFFGTLAWSGFLALRTVLDPERSEEIAEDMLTNEHVRAQLVSNIGNSLRALLPLDTAVTDEQIDGAASAVLDDEQVRALFIDSLVRTHGAFLGEGTAPDSLDAGAVADAMRSAAVALAPGLDDIVPESPALVIELPTDNIPNASPLRSLLQKIVPLLAGLAVIGIAISLLTTNDRPSILRRAGTWALTTTAFVLAVGFVLPWVVRKVLPNQAEILAAFVGAVLRTALLPGIVLAAVGIGLHATAFALGHRPDRRRQSQRIARREARPRASVPANPGLADATTTLYRPTPGRTPSVASQTIHSNTAPHQQIGTPTAAAEPAPAAQRSAFAPTWQEGVGWIVHPKDPSPPKTARWVAGIGYVVDGPPPRSGG